MSQSRQADTLARHIRNGMKQRPEWVALWENVEREYRRTAKAPTNTIGMLADMAAECFVTWSARPDGRVSRGGTTDGAERRASGASEL